MRRYKEKYAGSPEPRSQKPAQGGKAPRGNGEARRNGPAARPQKQASAAPKAPAKKPGLFDRIKRIFGAGKDAD